MSGVDQSGTMLANYKAPLEPQAQPVQPVLLALQEQLESQEQPEPQVHKATLEQLVLQVLKVQLV
jgi:hypothetical protein